MISPIADDAEMALGIRLERMGVLIGHLADLQFAEAAEPEKLASAVQSAVLSLEHEYRDTRSEQDYFFQKAEAQRERAA